MPFPQLALLSFFPIIAMSKFTTVLDFNFEYYNDPKRYTLIEPENNTSGFGITLCVRIRLEVWKKSKIFESDDLFIDLNNFNDPGWREL